MGRDGRIVGRIAPSPSGLMHLGNAFSALLAWAFARSENGEFVVRLENLDERCQNPAYVKGVLAGSASNGTASLSCRPSAWPPTR